MLAPLRARVSMVACHPKQDILAVGYSDGTILMVRMEDGAEILAKRPGEAPVTALNWSADGLYLVFGTENGEAGICKPFRVLGQAHLLVVPIPCAIAIAGNFVSSVAE